jgi:hypothetical protein
MCEILFRLMNVKCPHHALVVEFEFLCEGFKYMSEHVNGNSVTRPRSLLILWDNYCVDCCFSQQHQCAAVIHSYLPSCIYSIVAITLQFASVVLHNPSLLVAAALLNLFCWSSAVLFLQYMPPKST